MKKNLPILDYKIEYKKQLQKNIEDMKKHKMSKEYLMKVENFIEKFELDEEKIMKEYKKDSAFALFFVKEPGRQSFHEKTAAKFIKSLNDCFDVEMFQNFKNLPASGKNTLFISRGSILKKSELQGNSDGKSIDFYWEYNYKDKKFTFYASHKYTETSGGSQDNQKKDIMDFMEGARQNTSKNTKFYAITDGDYYSDLREEMNARFPNKIVKTLCINDLPLDVAVSIKEWLKENFGEESVDEIKKFDVIIDMYEENK